MARKPLSTVNPPVIVTDADTPGLPAMVEAANQLAIAHDARMTAARAVAIKLGYELPADSTDPDLIQRDIAANMRRSVEACLEVGRGLRVLKEACEHGDFCTRLEMLQFEQRTANRFMAAALKFSKWTTSSTLLPKIGTTSKLLEMLVLDDEQIEELELTGQTGELRLDDIATMSVKELRSALREERANAEANSRLLSDKNKKIDDLTARMVRETPTAPMDWPDELRGFVAQTHVIRKIILENLANLESVRRAVMQSKPMETACKEDYCEEGLLKSALGSMAWEMGSTLQQVTTALSNVQHGFDQTLGCFDPTEGRFVEE